MNHGEYIHKFGNGINNVIKQLKEKQASNRAIISLINQENIMEKLGEYQVLIDDIMSGNIDENLISKIFSKLNLTMASGAVFGGAIIALLNNYMPKTNQKEEE